ncbi:MAG: NAD-binding protein [Nitrososphaerales archaeon]|jgi:voltage-gated potassium channel
MDPAEDRVLPYRRNSRIKRESRRLGFTLYSLLYEPIVFLEVAYKQLAILFVMFLSGALIFARYEHLPPIDAFLASVSTITTIGLYVPNGGNFVTLNRTEAFLLIAMIIVSVGAGASILQATVGAFVNGNLARGKAEERMTARLKKHIIVYGYGHLGKYVVEKLDELGIDYVVVTTEQQFYDALIKSKVLAVLEHETRPMDALKAAGIDRAGTLIVSHQNDPNNMMVTLSARRLRPDLRIISVVHDSELIEAAKNAGADVVIPSSVTVGHLLALSAVTKDLVGVVFSEEIGTKEIARFTVFKSSELIGKGMQEVSKLAMVIGVVRGAAVVQNIFEPDFRLKEGDTILVLGDPGNLETLEKEARAT